MNSTPATSLGLPRALRAWLLLGAGLVLLAGGALQTARAQSQEIDPPGRAARLASFDGQVWLYHPDQGEWVSAGRNRPLTRGDRIATDPGARAELQVGSITVRVDASTELEVQRLDDDEMALDLRSGSVFARVPDASVSGAFEVQTEVGRFVVRRSGSYRVDHTRGTSHATVYRGEARYEGPNSGLAIGAGQRAEFWVDSGGVAQYALSAPVNDAFFAWNNDRDRRHAAGGSSRYVSPEMTGADELDRYGRWEQSPEYGALWIPANVGPNWAPYSNGHWTWVSPWGWTWVDDAPWGFAPFHYGRWVYLRNNWCWTPGTRVVRPVYAPALVAWVGGPRGGGSIGIGAGSSGPSVGWFPLAPREVYVPSYRVSPRYVQNINLSYVGNAGQITRIANDPLAPREFANRRTPRAVTIVPTHVLTERRPVAPASADFRRDMGGRDLISEPGRTRVMVAPQVSPPPLAARIDERNIAQPPEAAGGWGDRPGFGRPAQPAQPVQRERERDRDRGDDDRRGGRRADGTSGFDSPVSPASPMAPVAPVAPGARMAPAAPAAPLAQPSPPANPMSPMPPRPAVRQAPLAVQPAPPVPAAVPPAPAAPEMRVLPMRRGDDRPGADRRIDERRIDERRAMPRGEAPAAPATPGALEPRGPQRVERPLAAPGPAPALSPPPAPRPAPAPVALPQPAAPRPVEVQRVAPTPATPPAPAAAGDAGRPQPAGRFEPREPREPRGDREPRR